MSCSACRDIEAEDGEPPRCETEAGCLIPPLDREGTRIIEIWDTLHAIEGVVGSDAVLRIYDATVEDVRILRAIQEALKANGGRQDNS